MRKISVMILLCLVRENDAKDSFDNLSGTFAQRLSDKLLDRAHIAGSRHREDLDHATIAKSGTRARLAAGQRRTHVPKALPEGLLDTFPMASLKARIKASWRNSLKNSRFARLVQQGATAALEQADHLRIPQRLGVENWRTATASVDGGSQTGYLGRLASFPGVIPEVANPEEAASVRIAGLTPIETPESLSPRKSSDVQEKVFVPEVSEQSDGMQSTDTSRTGTPRSAMIDSDIDSSIMNDPRRKAPRKHIGTETSDGEMEDIVMKAWRYSHGVLPTPTKKALKERQFPRTSK